MSDTDDVLLAQMPSRLRDGASNLERTPGYADSCGSSRLHLPGTVDQLSRDRSVGEPSGVSALVVVEAHVGVELALEPAIAQVEVAGKRRSPALLEDRSVEALDV